MIGCTSGNNSEISDEAIVQKKMFIYLNKGYSENLSLFEQNLINHFPSEIDSSYIQDLGSFSPDVGEISLFLERKINMSEFESLTNHYSFVSKEILKPKDSLLVVNRFSNIEGDYKYGLTMEKAIIEKTSSYSLPVPNFNRSYFSSEKTPCHLSNSFKLYIIDAKKGRYMPDSCLTKGEHMPSDWKNGFSKGIAISKDSLAAIYWIVVW